MKRLLSLLALFLCACGGGGGGTPATQAVAVTPAPTAAPAPVAIAVQPALFMFVGNSLQAGLTPGAADPHPPAVDVAQALGVRVIVEAFGGVAAQQILDGTDGSGATFERRVTAYAPKVVFIQAATNGTQSGSEYAATLRTLVQQAKAAGASVVLETPPPVIPSGSAAIWQDLPTFYARVQATRNVAAETGAVLCDHYADIAPWVSLGVLPDGVHPTADVYAFIGRTDVECARQITSHATQ